MKVLREMCGLEVVIDLMVNNILETLIFKANQMAFCDSQSRPHVVR